MTVFAGYPAPFVYDGPDGTRIQQLIWGDEVAVTGGGSDGWLPVKARNARGREGTPSMRTGDLQDERVLELNFGDVGQGDSCLIVTPGGEYLIIDAGERDNLWWFLRWRFGLEHDPSRVIHIRDLVVTHGDGDHYGGLEPLLASGQITIGTLWHNGIIERAAEPRLGPVTGTPAAGFLTGVIETQAELAALLGDDAATGRARYPELLRTALASGRVGNIAMASTELGYLPGYGPGDQLSIQVLGPVAERVDGTLRLPRLGTDSQTKNGNSVVLRLQYRNVSVLLGGDLNTTAERRLLEHHTAAAPDPAARAREVFGVDIAKVCHHGSADFLDDFLACQQPAAWVVSSGDNEPYAHPRPGTLGALGHNGRGERPLIFSTELARSPAEFGKRPEHLRARDASEIDAAVVRTTAGRISAEGSPAVAGYQRAIAVYGMIAVRTDGTRALISTKLERPRPGGQEWDSYRLEPDAAGVLHEARGGGR